MYWKVIIDARVEALKALLDVLAVCMVLPVGDVGHGDLLYVEVWWLLDGRLGDVFLVNSVIMNFAQFKTLVCSVILDYVCCRNI